MEDMMTVQAPQSGPDDQQINKKVNMRNLLAFWLLGLCNHYGFFVMLSAAHDILDEEVGVPQNDLMLPDVVFNLTNNTETGRLHCNSFSTGAVLLAGVLPLLIIELSAPWFADYVPYGIRNVICVVASASSFLIVGLDRIDILALSLVGIVFAGVCTGLGECTYISLLSFYDKGTVSTFSSGTGAAGLVGSLSYAGLTEFLTPRNALLIMLVVPVVMIVSYWGILVRVPTRRPLNDDDTVDGQIRQQPPDGETREDTAKESKSREKKHLTLRERFGFLKHLVKCMIPLMLVDFGQYFTNQGLVELIYFEGFWLTHEAQYRWFQVLYQLGACISRSSVNILKIKRLWVLPLLEWCLMVLVFSEAYFAYMPNISIVFVTCLLVGLVGGSAYVNTFYQVRQDVTPKFKEFALGTTVVASAIGITLAGVIALPVHDALCGL